MSHQNQVEFTLWVRENQKAFLKAAKVICFDSQNAEDVLQEALADVYEEQTAPINHFYRTEGLLITIDADGEIAEITERATSALARVKA